MDVSQYPVVEGIASMQRIIENSIRTKRPALFLGPPGTGKTAATGPVAEKLKMARAFLELGLTVPEEIGGCPVRDEKTGMLIRLPLGPIAQACSMPTLLVIDEVTRADSGRQGAAMTGVNERRWGDYKLHPESAVILLGNEPESGGTHTILDALLNRCGVYRLRANADEVRFYLSGLGAEGSALRYWASDYASFSEHRPGELLQIEPPRGFADSGALWASPRAIEHGVTRLASLQDSGLDPTDQLGLTELQGVVGLTAGVTFMALRRLKDKCPSTKEIIADPLGVRLPVDLESTIAMSPIILETGKQSPDAAWIYLDRVSQVHRDASKIIQRKLFSSTKPPSASGKPIFERAAGQLGTISRSAAL